MTKKFRRIPYGTMNWAEIGRDLTDERNSYLVLTFDFSTVQVGTIAA